MTPFFIQAEPLSINSVKLHFVCKLSYSIFSPSFFFWLILTHLKSLNVYLIFSWKPLVMSLWGVLYFLYIIIAGMLLYRVPASRRQRQEDHYRFEVSLVYIAGSRQDNSTVFHSWEWNLWLYTCQSRVRSLNYIPKPHNSILKTYLLENYLYGMSF